MFLTSKSIRTPFFLAIAIIGLPSISSAAPIMCQNNKTPHQLKILTQNSCPAGYRKVLDLAIFKGAAGARGDRGERGEVGAQGAAGSQGNSGAQGPQGAVGPQGAKGDKGDQGDPGSNATAFIGNTSGTPLSALPSALAPSGSAAASPVADILDAEMPAPQDCVAKSLYVSLQTAPATTATRTFALAIDGVDSALACTITGAQTSCEASGNVAIARTEGIAIRATASVLAVPSAAKFYWTCE